MGEPVGEGDWVECVKARPPFGCGFGRRWPLIAGAIYRIERVVLVPVGAHWSNAGEETFVLAGIQHPQGDDAGFGVFRFRPIYRPKAGLIESLKAPPQTAPRERENA